MACIEGNELGQKISDIIHDCYGKNLPVVVRGIDFLGSITGVYLDRDHSDGTIFIAIDVEEPE